MAWAGNREPQPYQRAAQLTMPVDAPETAADDDPVVTGRDGQPRSYRTGLPGLAPPAPASREDRMTWDEVC